MADNGRRELARRLHRIFITPTRGPGAGKPVDEQTLLNFADDLLAGDYMDPRHGPRPGDGGPPARFEVRLDG